MRALLAVVIALGIVGVRAQNADANTGVHIAGATCVPNETSISKYSSANGGMTFAAGQTGVIHFHCAIPYPELLVLQFLNKLQMTYASSAADANNYVSVELYKLSKADGTLLLIAGITSTYVGCGNSTGKSCANAGVPDNLNDSDNYYYFIAVHIARNTASNTEIFWGASVTDD